MDEVPQTATNRLGRGSWVGAPLSYTTQQSICRLLAARNYAEDAGRDVWEFAVTIGELRREGVTESELRWLVCRGYVEHAAEAAAAGNERNFDRDVSLRFSKRSAFVIAGAGEALARELLNGGANGETRVEVNGNSIDTIKLQPRLPAPVNGHNGANGAVHVRPKWDRDRRELRLGDKLIKVFKLPSPMQEAVLMAFEEERWRPRIDDPLPGHPDHLPKRRLHDTIKSLNRNQKNCLIRFMGDGTGEGVRWELVSPEVNGEHSNLDQA